MRDGGNMMVYRAFVPAVVLAASLHVAEAQFGGMPGGPSFGGAPIAPSAACQQLLAIRDETQKNANAIQKASEKKAGPDVACKLFRTFLDSESKMIKAI